MDIIHSHYLQLDNEMGQPMSSDGTVAEITMLGSRFLRTSKSVWAVKPSFGSHSARQTLKRRNVYGEAAAKAQPNAVQVADRWHLMENVSSAFLDAVHRSMRVIRTAIGTTTINPKLNFARKF